MELRLYQSQTIDLIREEIRKGNKRILVVLPTGAGKTHVLGNIASSATLKENGVLALMHRRQLVTQMVDVFQGIGVESDIIMAGFKSELKSNVQAGTIQTYHRRLKIDELYRNRFFVNAAIVMIDEAHHIFSKTYQSVLENYKDKIIIGVTATPILSSGIGMGEFFESIVAPVTVQGLINDGYLVPGIYYGPSEPDLSKVDTVAGDYHKTQLNKIMNQPKLIGDVVDNWVKYGENRKTMVFAVKVNHSKALCLEFNRRGIPAEHLDAHHDDDERNGVLERFRNGETTVLCNVALFCLDDKTEILTIDGWRGIEDLLSTDKIANWNNNGEIFFNEPKYIVKRDLLPSEFFVSSESRSTNIRVTNNHKVINKCRNGVLHKTDAENLIDKVFQYPVSGVSAPIVFGEEKRKKLVKMSKSVFITKNSFCYRKTKGLTREKSKQEAERIWNIKSKIQTKLPHELSLNECKFIGFWIGDGSVNKLIKGGVEYKLYQTRRYPDTIQWVDKVVSSLGYNFIKREKVKQYNGKKCYNLIDWSLCRGTGGRNQHKKGIYGIEPYLRKDGTKLFFGLNYNQTIALLYGFWLADGDHIPQKTKSISNINKRLLDILQALCVCRGISASIHSVKKSQNLKHSQQYIFTYKPKQKYRNIAGKFRLKKDQNQTGSVWCVKSDSGNIITRRNGIVCVTGNTEGTDIPEISCLSIARPTKSLGLHLQILGRGARPFPGKKDFIVLDHGGNISRLQCFYEDEIQWTLGGKKLAYKFTKPRKKTKTLLSCEMCLTYFSGSRCPRCGFEVVEYGKKIEALDADLVNIGKKKKQYSHEDKKMWWSMLEGYRQYMNSEKDKDWKPGWTANKYREKFGCWPQGVFGDPTEPNEEVKRWIQHLNIKYAKSQKRKERYETIS